MLVLSLMVIVPPVRLALSVTTSPKQIVDSIADRVTVGQQSCNTSTVTLTGVLQSISVVSSFCNIKS